MKCGVKTIYKTKKKAIKALSKIKSGKRTLCGYPIRIYKCPTCNMYHLTSLPKRTS